MGAFEDSVKGNRYVSWILRGSLFLVTIVYLLFSFDVFSIDGGFWQKVDGFAIHNIYTLVMFLILYIAWESENLAGFLLIGMSISMVFFFGGPSEIRGGSWMMISLPAIVGVLFLLNYYLIKSKTKA
jgi:hypothetical protein